MIYWYLFIFGFLSVAKISFFVYWCVQNLSKVGEFMVFRWLFFI